jgi:hypothetical protein
MEMFDLSDTRNALGFKKVYKQTRARSPEGIDKEEQELFYDPMIDINNEVYRLKKISNFGHIKSQKKRDIQGGTNRILSCCKCFREFGNSLGKRVAEIGGEIREMDEVMVTSALHIVIGSRVEQEFNLREHEEINVNKVFLLNKEERLYEVGSKKKEWMVNINKSKKRKLAVFDEEWDARQGPVLKDESKWKLKSTKKERKWNVKLKESGKGNKEVNFKVECVDCKEFVGIFNFQTNKCLIFQ